LFSILLLPAPLMLMLLPLMIMSVMLLPHADG
jgi:hypothetical protein